MARTIVGKGGSFASRFDPDNFETGNGRPGFNNDVDTAAMAAAMAKAAADDSWMSKPIGYYGNDDWSKRSQYLHDKQKKKELKKGEYEYSDNASGALEKLYDLGYGYDTAIQRATAAGINKLDSLNDVDAIIAYEQKKFGSKDKNQKKDKNKDDYPEFVENPYKDEPEGLDPFVKATKDNFNDFAQREVDGTNAERMFPLGTNLGQIGTGIPSPGAEYVDGSYDDNEKAESFAAQMKAKIIADLRKGYYADEVFL